MKKSMLFAGIILIIILLVSIFLFKTIPTFNNDKITNNDKSSIKLNNHKIENIKKNEITKEVHEHVDFKVYLDGKEYNFSKEKYMSEENKTLSQIIHLHDMDGNVIHKHANGVTLGQFFESYWPDEFHC